jgi:hypothetical protein
MGFASDSSAWEHEPVSTIILSVLLSAFSILAAFQFRDVLNQAIDKIHEKNSKYKLAISVLLTSMFFFILVWLSWNFGDRLRK